MSESGSPVNKSPLATVPDRDRDLNDERPERMRDWIVRMVNSGRFHGLEWINNEKNVFRVPWIHAKKRGYCKERDAALFREWAIHSGKYRDESDPTVWKINFRCAINGLKDIMEIKDMQTEDCRVYKVLPSRSRRRKPRRRFPNTEPYGVGPILTPEMEYAQHYYSATMSTLPAATVPETMFPVPPISSSHFTAPMLQHRIKTEFKPELPPCSNPTPYPTTSTMSPYNFPPPYSSSMEQSTAGYYSTRLPSLSTMPMQVENGLPIHRQDSPDSGINDTQHSPLPMTGDQPNAYCSMPSSVTTLPTASPSYPISPYPSPRPGSVASSPQSSISSVMNSGDDDDIKHIIDELSDTPGPSPLPSPSANELQVQVYFGSIPVFQEPVTVTSGCRIFFDPRYCGPSNFEGTQKLFGPTNFQQIQLPECHPNPYAKDIFNAMSRGLVIELVDHDIYATPLCRTVVYCGQRSTTQSYPLNKENRTKVFDYAAHFRPSLEHYALSNGIPPSSQVLFSLGQPWGQSCPAASITQTLVSVLVSHTEAQQELDTIGLPAALTRDLFIELPDSIDIGKPNISDLQAEAFLTQCSPSVQ